MFLKRWKEVQDIPLLKKQNKINRSGELMLIDRESPQGMMGMDVHLCSEGGRHRG